MRRWRMVVALVAALAPSSSAASGRQFAYTQESLVAGVGEWELEPWTTYRHGREEPYDRLDLRLELETGLARSLQGALYLNLSGIATAGGTEVGFEGVSAELKYKLSDPVADVLGSALYLELTGAPEELELEGKLIVDRRVGDFLLGANLVLEREWRLPGPGAESKLSAIFGAGWHATSRLLVGLELRNRNVFPAGRGLGSSVLYAGPTVAWAGRGWWGTLALQPQLGALKGATTGRLDLDEHERFEARLLLGFFL